MDTQTNYDEGVQLQRAALPELLSFLQEHQARTHDIVTPAKAISYMAHPEGTIELHEYSHEISEEGVTQQEQVTPMELNGVADAQMREKLDIPKKYWDRMVGDHSDLRAENANYWLKDDERSFMLRTLDPMDPNEAPLVRAILSDRYFRMDDLDVLSACLDGVREAGIVDPSKLDISCDRTARRLYVRITAPEIGVAAADIQSRYRDPRSGRDGRDYPMMWAGLVLSNSETGHGSTSLTPRIVEQVCTNGMTRRQDVSRSVHIGQQLEEGVVDWSADTQQKALDLMTAKTADACKSFLSTEYVERVVEELREFANKKIADPLSCVEHVGKELRYSEERTKSIMAAFIAGADVTPKGVGSALTSVAIDSSPDAAWDLENDTWKAMQVAHAFA